VKIFIHSEFLDENGRNHVFDEKTNMMFGRKLQLRSWAGFQFTVENYVGDKQPSKSVSVWRVQKKATKLISELSKKLYRERLKIVHLPTLKYRRYRLDMIELFKIIKEIYDPTCIPHVNFVELSEDLIRTY